MQKDTLLIEASRALEQPELMSWYEKNLQGYSQDKTVDALAAGVLRGEITVRQALYLALIVGVQWEEKFEGVP